MSLTTAPTLTHFLVLGAILFAIAIVGIFLNRRNVIILLMAIELMLLAVNLNFIAFSHYLGDMAGQVFVFFILTVAAAESAIGLAILVLLFRNVGSIDVEDLGKLRADAMDMKTLYLVVPLAPAGRVGGRRPLRAAAGPHAVAHALHPRRRGRAGGLVRRAGATSQAGNTFNGDLYTWAVVGGAQARRRLPRRSAHGDDDDGGDLRLADGARLHHRLHGRRPGLHALLQLHLAVHLLDAHARHEQQLPAALLRLGGGRPRVATS